MEVFWGRKRVHGNDAVVAEFASGGKQCVRRSVGGENAWAGDKLSTDHPKRRPLEPIKRLTWKEALSPADWTPGSHVAPTLRLGSGVSLVRSSNGDDSKNGLAVTGCLFKEIGGLPGDQSPHAVPNDDKTIEMILIHYARQFVLEAFVPILHSDCTIGSRTHTGVRCGAVLAAASTRQAAKRSTPIRKKTARWIRDQRGRPICAETA